MKVQVTINNVKIIEPSILNENEYNIHECEFEFVEEYNGLSKKAIFTNEAGADYIVIIVNDKCSIPSEVLKEKEFVKLGVYAYDVENEELVLRYSPKPTEFYVQEGSYKNAGGTPPTPSEIEQLQAQITHNRNDIEDIQNNIVEINEQQEIQDETIQNNIEAIGTINENIGTINEIIGDLQEEQVEQNRNIQGNADDIEEIQQEQITQNTNIQKNTDDIVNINQAIDTLNIDITDIDSAIGNINEDIDNLEQDLTNYSLITETGSQINLNVNSTNYQITAILKDKNGNVIYTSNAIDLPIESMIVNARYDNTTKEIVLTLQNGNTLRISVADLISGLVSETQLQTILANYYTKTEVDNLLSAKANQSSLDTTNQNLTNLAERVSTNEEDIADIKEEQTTQNTNIEELQNQVETLQEDLDNANSEIAELNTDITNMAKAMYKVDGQGSDITLQNTSENKFVEFGLEGRTEQEQLSGKNLFDGNFVKKYIDQTTGQPTSYEMPIYRATENYIELKANIEYIASRQDTAKGIILYYYEKNGDFISASADSQVNIQTTRLYDRDVLLKVVLMNCENDKDYTLQLEQGSTATSYEPYCGGIPAPNHIYKIPIKNVTGNANVKIQNKNLFDKKNMQNGFIPSSGDYPTSNPSYPNARYYLVPVKANDSVTISGSTNTFGRVRCIDKKTNKVIGTIRSITDDYYTSNSDYASGFINGVITAKKDIILAFMVIQGTDTLDTFQVEYGSIATSYVEHQEQNYPFTFAEGQRGMQGTQLLDDGIHQKRNQISLIDDYIGSLITLSNGNKAITAILPNKKRISSLNLLCDRAINKVTFNEGTFYENPGNIVIIGNENDTLETLKEKYIGSIFEYTLEQEEIIPYNSTQQAQYNSIKQARSYDDITIISSESDELGFDMNVVAVADANKVINSLDTRLLALESEV